MKGYRRGQDAESTKKTRRNSTKDVKIVGSKRKAANWRQKLAAHVLFHKRPLEPRSRGYVEGQFEATDEGSQNVFVPSFAPRYNFAELGISVGEEPIGFAGQHAQRRCRRNNGYLVDPTNARMMGRIRADADVA